jgi:hypothetical protein
METTPANDDAPSVLHPEFGDPLQLLNMRAWLQAAVEQAGAIMSGGGCGMGEADIDVRLEGHDYNIRIKPIIRNTDHD